MFTVKFHSRRRCAHTSTWIYCIVHNMHRSLLIGTVVVKTCYSCRVCWLWSVAQSIRWSLKCQLLRHNLFVCVSGCSLARLNATNDSSIKIRALSGIIIIWPTRLWFISYWLILINRLLLLNSPFRNLTLNRKLLWGLLVFWLFFLQFLTFSYVIGANRSLFRKCLKSIYLRVDPLHGQVLGLFLLEFGFFLL